MEAVVKKARTTKHPWLVDANMDPEDFNRNLWHKSRCMFLETPEKESPRADPRAHMANSSRERMTMSSPVEVCVGEIEDMEVVEDFESRPHKEVTRKFRSRGGEVKAEKSK